MFSHTPRTEAVAAFALTAGILVSGMLSIPLWIISAGFIMIAGLRIIFNKTQKTMIFRLLTAAGFFLLGMILLQVKEAGFHHKEAPWESRYINAVLQIVSDAEFRENQTAWEAVLLKTDDWDTKGKQIRILLKTSQIDDVKKLPSEGDIVRVNGFFISAGSSPSDKEFFDYGKHLKHKGFSGQIILRNSRQISFQSKGSLGLLWDSVFGIRKRIINSIKESLPAPYSQILLGMMLGRRYELTPPLMKVFMRTGTMHILAASGLHASIIIAASLLLLSWIGVKGKLKFVLAGFFLIIYALIAGISPSITRASIMGLIYLLASIVERKYDPIKSLYAAVIIMLAVNPYNLFLAGFQLSAAAVGAILYYIKPMLSLFPPVASIKTATEKIFAGSKALPKICCGIYSFIIASLSISILIQLTLMPIFAYYFNRVSLINIPANIIVVPIAGICLPAGFAGGLIGLIIPPLGRLLLLTVQIPLNILLVSLSYLSGLNWAEILVPSPGFAFFIVYYSGIILAASSGLFKKRWRKYIVSFVLLIFTLFLLTDAHRAGSRHEMTIIWDKNYGAAVIDKLHESSLILFSNKKSSRKNISSLLFKVSSLLKKRGIYKLNSVITALDAFPPEAEDLLREYKVDNLITYGKIEDTILLDRLKNESLNREIRFLDLTEGIRISTPNTLLETQFYEEEESYLILYSWPQGRLLLSDSENSAFIESIMEMEKSLNSIILTHKAPEGIPPAREGKSILKDSLYLVRINKKNVNIDKKLDPERENGSNNYITIPQGGVVKLNLLKIDELIKPR